MSPLSSPCYQHRTFESTYLFKIKKDEITLKILDLSQKSLFKRTFSAKELSLSEVHQSVTQGSFSPILEKLVERELLPKEHLPNYAEAVQTAPEKVLDQIIEQFKPTIFVERKELKGFTCPLTLDIFQEPVMDEHGHTFEKRAIETHLQTNTACPLNRQPIHSLTPNRLVKETIEEWQKEDPIPNFSLFQKENSKLAQINLQTAQAYVEEKEYNEALEFYAKAFQYTKDDGDYAPLPSLFETMGEEAKATLAYLYLAKYQLLAGKILEAIETLESCQRGKSPSLQINLALIELYFHSNQPEKALALSIQTAETFSKENPTQAAVLYRRILQHYPEELPFYFSLAALLEHPQEKGQILLKGALEALRQGNYQTAERLIQEGESCCEVSFANGLVSLELLKKQGDGAGVKQKLAYLAKACEKKGMTKEALSAYKMLFQLERNPTYCQKILNAYQALQNPAKEFQWSFTSIALLMEEKKWEQGEALAKKTLQTALETEQQVFLYEKLEEIYTHWHGHELQNLWPKLGKAYQQSKQLMLAEKTYRKAFERFHRFEEALALAEVLKESGKTQESVHTYYEAAVEALLEQNTERLSLCSREIKQIDPHLQHLDLNQRMHLLTQEHILKLSKDLDAAHQKIASLEQQKGVRQRELKTTSLAFPTSSFIGATPQVIRPSIRERAFGKAKWEKYFGEIGVEPPLPPNIEKILNRPCIFWPGKKVHETHLLVLIPETVNGRAFHLDSLSELIESPKRGHKTEYKYYNSSLKKELGTQSAASRWVLMTKDVIPESRYKSYKGQKALVEKHAQTSQIPYAFPKALEAATAIFIHYVQTGERIYTNIYTRCQERVDNNQWPAAIGGFSPGGLHVNYFHCWSDVHIGVRCAWKL